MLDSAKNALLIPSSAISTRPANATRNSGSNTQAASSTQNKSALDRTQGPRSERLNLNAAQQQLVKEGKATLSVVRVLQADGQLNPNKFWWGLITASMHKCLRA